MARHLIQLHVSGAFPLSPPELQQLQGLLAGSSHQTYDIFSMGHILYQMTTGVWTYADVDWCDGDSHACDSRQLLDMRPLGWQLAPAAWQVRFERVQGVFLWGVSHLPLHNPGMPVSSFCTACKHTGVLQWWMHMVLPQVLSSCSTPCGGLWAVWYLVCLLLHQTTSHMACHPSFLCAAGSSAGHAAARPSQTPADLVKRPAPPGPSGG